MALIKMVSEEQWCESLTVLYSRKITANTGNSFKEFQWIGELEAGVVNEGAVISRESFYDSRDKSMCVG